jgi:mRNA interferase MazF
VTVSAFIPNVVACAAQAGVRSQEQDISRGLPKKSWLKISQIRTLSAERIGKRIGKATPEEIEHALAGLNEIIGT